jgi:hypothetical protein
VLNPAIARRFCASALMAVPSILSMLSIHYRIAARCDIPRDLHAN